MSAFTRVFDALWQWGGVGGGGMSEILRQVQALVSSGAIRISQHGLRELAADHIDLEDVLAGIAAAILVEEYPTSRKEPSVLSCKGTVLAHSCHVGRAEGERQARRSGHGLPV
jgi:hypothetical protein